MQVNPIISPVSFGNFKKENNEKTLLFPLAIAGGVSGFAYSQFEKLKLNPDNIDSFIKTADEKLPMADYNKNTFEILKNFYKEANEKTNKRFYDLGIDINQKEICKTEFLEKYVDANQAQKNIIGLNHDIEWVKGEINQGPEKKLAYEEKVKIKNLIENTSGENLSISKIKNIFLFNEKCTKINIETELKDIKNLAKKFNKKRLFLFTGIGLTVGAILGHLIKIKEIK